MNLTGWAGFHATTAIPSKAINPALNHYPFSAFLHKRRSLDLSTTSRPNTLPSPSSMEATTMVGLEESLQSLYPSEDPTSLRTQLVTTSVRAISATTLSSLSSTRVTICPS
jgi:hypothetical protein